MVFHSASASFSSLSFSRNSHDYTATTSSSSHSTSSPASSPSSSPPHATNSLPPTPDQSGSCCVSPPHHAASPPSSIVPFSWEEKPGVIKKEIMQTTSCSVHHECSSYTPATPVRRLDQLDMFTHIQEEADPDFLQPPSYIKHVTTPGLVQQPIKASVYAEDLPPIRPPPCLSHAELFVKNVAGGDDKLPGSHTAGVHQFHQRHHHHRSGSTSVASTAGSKFMSSISLHNRRHHRNTTSPEDDPFWLAMVACTNYEADNSTHARRKHPKRFLSCELSRTDTRLARRLHESIHLDHCMPSQPLQAMNNRSMSGKIPSSRGHETRPAMDAAAATRYYNGNVEDASSVQKCSSRRVHHMQTDVQTAHDEGAASGAATMHTARPGSKALKAGAELHGRCKALLKQQWPPVVDISCSSRGSKSSKRDGKHRPQLPDLFGCKSNHDLVLVSRFP